MVPGQSAEDLGQQCQKMGAGEDEEGGRGSGHLRQLPAAAGKVVGPGAGCCRTAASSWRGRGKTTQRYPGTPGIRTASVSHRARGESVSEEGNVSFSLASRQM